MPGTFPGLSTGNRKAAEEQMLRQSAEINADIVIIGGSVGGCAAALAAARNGKQVVMTEETDWIGGQFTSQGLSAPDEHAWIESYGRTQSYANYRSSVRAFYRDHYPLTESARSRDHLNPGDGWVSALCHEPTVALQVLYQMLAPYLSSGRLRILLNCKAIAAETHVDLVKAVTVKNVVSKQTTTLLGAYFLDATELGDLLPLTNTEYVTGAESHAQTGELHAPTEAQPHNIQAYTACFAVDYRPQEDHTIDKPTEYAFWRDYLPTLTPPYKHKLIGLVATSPYNLGDRPFALDPNVDPPTADHYIDSSLKVSGSYPRVENLWTYRRLVNKHNFVPGSYSGSITLVNWPQNDYWLGNLIDVPEKEAARHIKRAKQLSLSLLYWMQTEAPRPDGKLGWPGIRLRKDLVGTEDGIAKYPYIRESRRIKAEFTVTEAHVGVEQRVALTGLNPHNLKAESFVDSVGIGSYRLDLHPTCGGNNYVDLASLPHEIPLGSLIPQRMNNLIPACKNIGTTHLSSACYREHPIEWNIGEVAGLLAAFCMDKQMPPRQVRAQRRSLEQFQSTIQSQGVEIKWPKNALLTPA
jgi:hypothetical protein